MKLKLVVIVGAITVLTNVNVMGQHPYGDVEQTEWDIIVESEYASPSIVDFVTSYLHETEDELHGMLSHAWQRYLKHEPAEKGATMFVDAKNGYISYTVDDDLAYPDDHSGQMLLVELCYWNCADGIHKLFAENVVSTTNGIPTATEFDGLHFYLYDNNTKRMSVIYYIIEEWDGNDMVTYSLPKKGKDIVATIHTPSGKIQKTLVWDGYRFHYAK